MSIVAVIPNTEVTRAANLTNVGVAPNNTYEDPFAGSNAILESWRTGSISGWDAGSRATIEKWMAEDSKEIIDAAEVAVSMLNVGQMRREDFDKLDPYTYARATNPIPEYTLEVPAPKDPNARTSYERVRLWGMDLEAMVYERHRAHESRLDQLENMYWRGVEAIVQAKVKEDPGLAQDRTALDQAIAEARVQMGPFERPPRATEMEKRWNSTVDTEIPPKKGTLSHGIYRLVNAMLKLKPIAKLQLAAGQVHYDMRNFSELSPVKKLAYSTLGAVAGSSVLIGTFEATQHFIDEDVLYNGFANMLHLDSEK